jgi:hypothetical protein
MRNPTRTWAVVSAVSATLSIWLVAHVVAGVDLTVRSPGGHDAQVGPGSVALASLLAGLAACGLLAALQRGAPRPRATWIVIASAIVALSLVGPISLGQTDDAIAVLTSMHLAAAGVLIPTLARLTARRARSRRR